MKIRASAYGAALLCFNALNAFSEGALMRGLTGAEDIGTQAVRSADKGDLAGATSMSETSFDQIAQMDPIRSGTAVEAGSLNYRGNGLTPSLAMSASRSGGVEGAGASSYRESPAPKGWEGFKNGFSSGFGWTETPSKKILEGSIGCGNTVCAPTRDSLWKAPVSAVVWALLAVPAVVIGFFGGIKGALFGAQES